MITLGRMSLTNPIIASSGSLGFGGGYWWDQPLISAGIIKPECIGAVITKTLTLNPWRGNWRGWNSWQVLWPLCGGWVNAFGLTNRGLEWFIEQAYPHVYPRNLIVSINDPNPFNIPRMAKMLNQIDLLAVEVNLSCPNTPQWTDLQRSYDLTTRAASPSAWHWGTRARRQRWRGGHGRIGLYDYPPYRSCPL